MERKPKDFIEGTLIGTLGSLLPLNGKRDGCPYELFILLAVGIEFLGACEDDKDWHEVEIGLSKKRFLKGLELLGNEYLPHKTTLYKKLRCGMAHIFAPVKGLGLGENRHNTNHLTIISEGGSEKLTLNVQVLYNDFKLACEKILSNIEDNTYPLEHKLNKPFLTVPEEE